MRRSQLVSEYLFRSFRREIRPKVVRPRERNHMVHDTTQTAHPDSTSRKGQLAVLGVLRMPCVSATARAKWLLATAVGGPFFWRCCCTAARVTGTYDVDTGCCCCCCLRIKHKTLLSTQQQQVHHVSVL